MAQRPGNPKRNVVFIGETGAGKSSTINLLLNSGPTAPVSNDSHVCTTVNAKYETTLGDTKYDLWDTHGLGGARGLFRSLLEVFVGSPEKELKKFLKERHANRQIDLLVYCIHGSRARKTLSNHYDEFCAITRRLAAPIVVVVTQLEREKHMEDWWCRNSSDLERLGIEFDDHVCITTLPDHRRRAESKEKLVDLITKDRQWEAKESGSYFGSPVQKPTPPPPLLRRVSSLRRAMGRSNVGDESISRSSSNSSNSSVPSATGSSYYTASSPTDSTASSSTAKPPTRTPSPVRVPTIDTNLMKTSDPPQPPSESSSSMQDSLHSMFHSSLHSSYTSHSEVYLESCTDENEGLFSKFLEGDGLTIYHVTDHLGELPFRPSTFTVRRRGGWPTRRGAFGDIWECDLVSGHSSRMVAVKAVKTNINGNDDVEYHEKKFRRELKIWGRLQHKNIVPLLGVVPGFGPLPSTVSPWFRNGSLSCYLAEKQMSGPQKHRLLGDIAIGLRYLHSQGVIHGDLHSGNILIDDDGTACITDFGLSFTSDFLDTSYLKSSICGLVHFTDPALVQRVYKSQDNVNVFYPTKPCDIYSFGGVMLHVLSGKKPYDGISTQKTFLAVLEGERPQLPNNLEGITPWHGKLMLRCWDRDESKRPSASSLVRMFDRE